MELYASSGIPAVEIGTRTRPDAGWKEPVFPGCAVQSALLELFRERRVFREIEVGRAHRQSNAIFRDFCDYWAAISLGGQGGPATCVTRWPLDRRKATGPVLRERIPKRGCRFNADGSISLNRFALGTVRGKTVRGLGTTPKA